MTQVSPHGLHHVTAIATDPQSNVDFYTRALGLRLVKQTVSNLCSAAAGLRSR